MFCIYNYHSVLFVILDCRNSFFILFRLNKMLDFLNKIFGSRHEKEVKKILPIIDEINRIYEEYDELTDEEVRAKTDEFKNIIKQNSQDLEDEKEAISERLRNEALDANESLNLRDRLKAIDKEIFVVIEDTLNEILPQAFAAVKQACKRLKDSLHHYEYTGQSTVWDMVPYDVQLIGGIVMHQGKIAEMATGEGKTLVAVLPMYLNSLAGKGVHLVTVNDYLAKRDAEWMMPVYDFLGVTVGSIQSNMDGEERKKIYNMDISYGTNNEFGFDYLRDNMVVEMDQMVQRPHWFAMVDEVDSCLIDEARTPLIISGPVGVATDQKFDEMEPRVRRVVDVQNKLINQFCAEVSKLLESENPDSKEVQDQIGVLLLRSYHGLPKHKRLAKLLQEPDLQKLMKDTELYFMREQGARMHEIDDELYYSIEEKNHQIDLSDKGRQVLCTSQEDPDMFVIPDIAAEMSALEGDENISSQDKQTKIDQINLLYAERSDRIHTVSQLLRAYSLYEIDVEYVIQDGKVMIVDEFTGRILEGRRYSEGLHQAIEAKEKVHVERDTQTLATVTLQNYFLLYKKLAGMTGTADTEAGEFEKIYKLEVVVIPTNRKMIREDRDDLIFKTKREKYNSIVQEITKEIKNGRAVLVGTTSVEVSELLSKMLKRQNIPHNVLNAKQHQKEAEVVAHAGRKGVVTIATNMAGRGTDIKLDHDVRKNGGLAIIGSERHDARRIDRQLRGRAGRQGDPGSTQFFICLEDNLMRLFGGERIAGIMKGLKIPEGEAIQHSMITKSVERAQKKVEENNFGIRKRLLDYDNVMNMQREAIYGRRRNALRGERLKGELFEYIETMADDWFEEFKPTNNLKELKNTVRANLLVELPVTQEEFEKMNDVECILKILAAADDFYKRKEEMLGSEFMGYLEKISVLQTIDDKWREHLREMDDLKEGIHLRSYGQKDPLLEYKGEASKLFFELIKDINKESVNFAFKYFPKMVEQDSRTRGTSRREVQIDADGRPRMRNTNVTNVAGLQFSHSSSGLPSFVTSTSSGDGMPDEVGGRVAVRTYRKTEPTVGRNDPCPCGSGKKYKNCHGKVAVG
jgi:preprotein translocase subunit SecA